MSRHGDKLFKVCARPVQLPLNLEASLRFGVERLA
ncbi:hypothetical protein SBA4_1210043 [Candidatus Sulfopaludibacter sp. SbA4]|nr:hypothetical protein SBA4_1210043 [Candidatus Sulfopaludibacter sp. SbA4]